jgi:hypothetical protein
MTCDAADGSCTGTEDEGTGEFMVTIQNDSRYRADIYWDDERFGTFIATVELGEAQGLNVFEGHVLFVTRHGVRENLFVDNQPVKFIVEKPTEFLIPITAAPSDNPCQDRYNICESEAKRGSCQSTPGWMTVHCCQACDPYIGASKLIDPKVRCSNENLNMTGPIWKPGDLNKLFEEWYVPSAKTAGKHYQVQFIHHTLSHSLPSSLVTRVVPPYCRTGPRRKTTENTLLKSGQVPMATRMDLATGRPFHRDHGS